MDKYEIKICKFCDDMKEGMLKKYQRGRDEHNDPLESFDVISEFADEIKDIIIYYLILRERENDKR